MDTLYKLLGYVFLFAVVYIILRYFPGNNLAEITSIILALVITTSFIVTEKTVSFIYELVNSKCNCDVEHFSGSCPVGNTTTNTLKEGNAVQNNIKTCKVVCHDTVIESPYGQSPERKTKTKQIERKNKEQPIKVKIVKDKGEQSFGSMFEDEESTESEYAYIVVPKKENKYSVDKNTNEFGYSYLPNDWYRQHKEYPISIVKKVKDVMPNETGGITDGEKTWYLEKH